MLVPLRSKINTILVRGNMPKDLKISGKVNKQGSQAFIKALNKF